MASMGFSPRDGKPFLGSRGDSKCVISSVALAVNLAWTCLESVDDNMSTCLYRRHDSMCIQNIDFESSSDKLLLFCAWDTPGEMLGLS